MKAAPLALMAVAGFMIVAALPRVGTAQGVGAADAQAIAAIDEIARLALDRQRVPGIAVAVLRGDRLLLARGYGMANLEHQVTVTPKTMFQSGSVGKMFTAALILSLVEEGRLSLDASVRQYLPAAPVNWQPITLRHLLSHTAGVPDYTSDRFDYRRDYTEGELAAMAFAMPLEFPAGVRWNYSNTGYVVLGIVASQVTGRPYWEALRERIFTPSGMLTARINSEAEIVPHRASGYQLVDGAIRHQDWVAPLLNTTADGSLLLSLEDVIAWTRVVRHRRVLAAASWQAMLSPIRLASGRPYPYGFGWSISTRNGGSVFEHGGSWQGFQTQVSIFGAPDLSIVVLANSADAEPDRIAEQIAAAIDPGLTPPAIPTTARTDADPALVRYVRAILEKTAKGELSADDFEFVRQTSVPGMRRRYAELLQAGGAVEHLDLLQQGEEGDDVRYVFRVRQAAAIRQAIVTTGPGGRLTGLSIRPFE